MPLNAPARTALATGTAILFGALAVWAVRTPARLNEEDALCVLKLQPGESDASASFTTSQTIERFYMEMRPGARRESLSISITGSEGLIARVNAAPARFGCGLNIPPGAYTATLAQGTGNHGGVVVICDKAPTGITGWQILSRAWLGLLVLSGLWALLTRRSNNLKRRARSAFVFQQILLGFVLIFLYLLFHEGGHSLAELAFGRYDFARSDFWGIRGSPHSGGKMGPALEPWQQALISGGGPMLPTLAGWVLFVFWASHFGRRLRTARHIVNLYLSTIVAMMVFPFVAVGGCLLGIISDGDWHGFINNVPGPLWLVRTIAWGILVVNGLILWRVVPEFVRAWKARVSELQSPGPKATATPATGPS